MISHKVVRGPGGIGILLSINNSCFRSVPLFFPFTFSISKLDRSKLETPTYSGLVSSDHPEESGLHLYAAFSSCVPYVVKLVIIDVVINWSIECPPAIDVYAAVISSSGSTFILSFFKRCSLIACCMLITHFRIVVQIVIHA